MLARIKPLHHHAWQMLRLWPANLEDMHTFEISLLLKSYKNACIVIILKMPQNKMLRKSSPSLVILLPSCFSFWDVNFDLIGLGPMNPGYTLILRRNSVSRRQTSVKPPEFLHFSSFPLHPNSRDLLASDSTTAIKGVYYHIRLFLKDWLKRISYSRGLPQNSSSCPPIPTQNS